MGKIKLKYRPPEVKGLIDKYLNIRGRVHALLKIHAPWEECENCFEELGKKTHHLETPNK